MSEYFTFKGRKLAISKEEIIETMKNMRESSTERPGFFLKNERSFFRIREVLEKVQEMKGLKPAKLNGAIRYDVRNGLLRLGFDVWEKLRIKGEKDVCVWAKYVKDRANDFVVLYKTQKMVEHAPYIFNYVGQITVVNEEIPFLTKKSEKAFPKKRGVYLIFSSDEDSLTFYYVGKTDNLNEDLTKIFEISKIMNPGEEDLFDDEGNLKNPGKFMKKAYDRFYSKFSDEDTELAFLSTNMMGVILNNDFYLTIEPLDIYFLETKDARESDKIYSHVMTSKPAWNMEFNSVKDMGEKKPRVYQLKIEIEGSHPKIWRRILVKDSTTFFELHYIIQLLMDWTNEHLHVFLSKNYEIKNEIVPISSFLQNEKDFVSYIYDFGDEWGVKVSLEKILPFDKKTKLPVCLDGKMAGPLEDSGGVWKYMEDLEVLKNPYDEEYKEVVKWYGEEFDPEEFDVDKINKVLKKFPK